MAVSKHSFNRGAKDAKSLFWRALTHAEFALASNSALRAANSFGIHTRFVYSAPSHSRIRFASPKFAVWMLRLFKSCVAFSIRSPISGLIDNSCDMEANVASCLPRDAEAPSDVGDM